MTDPAITRLAEFTKRLGETQRFYYSLGVYAGPAASKSIAALCSDLTHVLAELEGARKALGTIGEIIDAWSDLAADPPKWRALTELSPSAHSALSLIWAQVDEVRAAQPHRDEEKEG